MHQASPALPGCKSLWNCVTAPTPEALQRAQDGSKQALVAPLHVCVLLQQRAARRRPLAAAAALVALRAPPLAALVAPPLAAALAALGAVHWRNH